ncbi:MAG: hypothetical protein GDA37_12360 [Ekhidna sp.]|nr:hypothetical protein [Ekhidna sp.]
MLRQSGEDCCDAIVVILNLQGFQNLEGCSNIIIHNGSFFHQNTSASVSESCGRVESLSQGVPSSKNKSECFAKAERIATMLLSLF